MNLSIGLILMAGTAAHAQSAAPPDADPVDLLMRVRDQVIEHGRRIPNHTCVETVERDRFEPIGGRSAKSCDTLLARRKLAHFAARLRLDATDRLRLDVAVGPDREIYSWAGAAQFEPGEIDRLIPEGAMGTGPFANLLLSVFDSREPRFKFEGENVRDATRLLQYAFDIPLEVSQYRAKAGSQWLPTGYTGTLLVDPRTAGLVRFSVRTEELPPATGLCEVDTTLDYGHVPLGGVDYLLPVATTQRFIASDGAEAENRVSFASCGELGDQAAKASEPPPSAVPLPPGLPMAVNIAGDIYSDRAAAGDRIEGRLAKAVIDSQGNRLAPQGALLEGRLMRVELHYSRPLQTTIAVRWECLEVNGVKSPVSLVPTRRHSGLKAVGLAVARAAGFTLDLPPIDDSRYGIYRFPGKWPVIPSGFRTEWLTADP